MQFMAYYGDNGGGLSTLAWTLSCGMSGISNLTCDMDIFKKDGLHYCFFTACACRVVNFSVNYEVDFEFENEGTKIICNY